MNPLLHALNIGTLANWLGVAIFGTVAVIVPKLTPAAQPQAEDVRTAIEDFTLGDESSREIETNEASENSPSAAIPLPAPPELPEIAEFPPLPEIPNLPAPAVKPAPTVIAPTKSAPSNASSTTRTASRNSSPARATSSSGTSSGTPGGQGPGSSDATRLAKGRMPPPSYPASARRAGQTGTVVVEFTVDASGRVISAYAKSPSPWPVLNDEAVRTVRRWKFPAGGVMKLQRPIVFQLR